MLNKEKDLNIIRNTIELIGKSKLYNDLYIKLTPPTKSDLFWGLIWGSIKGFLIALGIAFLIPRSVEHSQWGDLLGLALYLVWGYFIIKPVISYFKNKKLTSIPENIKKRQFAKERFDEISEFFKNDCPVPDDYRKLSILNKFESYLVNYRADSLKECINLYHDELYKMALIEEERAMRVYEQKRQAREMEHQNRVELELRRQSEEAKKQTDLLREQNIKMNRW